MHFLNSTGTALLALILLQQLDYLFIVIVRVPPSGRCGVGNDECCNCSYTTYVLIRNHIKYKAFIYILRYEYIWVANSFFWNLLKEMWITIVCLLTTDVSGTQIMLCAKYKRKEVIISLPPQMSRHLVQCVYICCVK